MHSGTEALQAIRRDRAPRLIGQQIEAAIMAGTYKPGDRLPTERDLAERFGTSRSSVREALRSLEQSGLVVVRRGAGGGAFVSQPGQGYLGDVLNRLAQLGQFDARQLYTARRLLEPGIAAEAARHATDEQLQALAAQTDELAALAAAGEDTAAASHRFHLLLAEATGNGLLVLLNAALLEQTQHFDRAVQRTPRPHRLTVGEHRAIVAALRERDAAAASRLALDHLVALGDYVLRELEGKVGLPPGPPPGQEGGRIS